jgi:hypothetical protein
MAPLQLNDITMDESKTKQRKKRGSSKKDSKNEEEAQEVLSEKVSISLRQILP